jgi:hypothetical protein
MNAVVIGGNKLTITLVPNQKKEKRPVIIKILEKENF